MIEFILKLLFVDLIYPLALELARRRETDPVFRAESDKAYAEVTSANDTAARKAAARKLYELQKNA